MNFSNTDIFSQLYSKNKKNNWSWVALPGSYGYLAQISQAATNNGFRFNPQSIEHAFDFQFPNLQYPEVEILLRRIANRLAVINGREIRVNIFPGNFQSCSDGAINGKVTFYFHPFDRDLLNRLGHKHPGKYISSKTKAYAKEIDGIWNLRLEITMRRAALKRYFPVIPRELQRLTRLCETFQFDDFFELKEMDYQAFRGKALNLAKKAKRGRMLSPRLVRMINEAESQPYHEQAYHMKEIAKLVKSRRLTENLRQFEKTMTLQETLSTPLSDEDENVSQ